jgi:hypothetical protein
MLYISTYKNQAMKKLLLLPLILSFFVTNAQTCATYAVQHNGTNHEWGVYNQSTGNVTGITSIATLITDYDNPNSCIDGANNMIYFYEVSGTGIFSVVSLNVGTGANSKQTVSDGGFLEYSSNTLKLHVVQPDASSNYQVGELDPTTGIVNNIITTTTPIGNVVGKSTLNKQSDDIYMVEENGAAYTLIKLNIITGNLTSLNITNIPAGGEIWFIEHDIAGGGNTYVILTNPSSWQIAQLNTVTGALSNINTISGPASLPSNVSYFDEQGGTFYYTVGGSVVGVDVTSSLASTQNIVNDIYVLEINNLACMVGIDELTSSSISIHPNPTKDWITVSLEEGTATSVTLRNSLGQLLLSDKTPSTNQVELDLSSYPTGIYFLQLEVDGKVITKKIIKE